METVLQIIVGIGLFALFVFVIRSIFRMNAKWEQETRAEFEKKKRASRFERRRISESETQYEVPGVVIVTAKTDSQRQQVEFDWRFLKDNTKQLVTTTYSDHAEVFADKSLDFDEMMAVHNQAMLMALFSLGKEDKKEGVSAPTPPQKEIPPAPKAQQFAPASKLKSDHAVRIFSRGVWYIQFSFKAGR